MAFFSDLPCPFLFPTARWWRHCYGTRPWPTSPTTRAAILSIWLHGRETNISSNCSSTKDLRTPNSMSRSGAALTRLCLIMCGVFGLSVWLRSDSSPQNTKYMLFLLAVVLLTDTRHLFQLHEEAASTHGGRTSAHDSFTNWAKCRLVPFYVRGDELQQNSATHKTF